MNADPHEYDILSGLSRLGPTEDIQASSEVVLAFLQQHKAFLAAVMDDQELNLLIATVELISDRVSLERALSSASTPAPPDSLTFKEVFDVPYS